MHIRHAGIINWRCMFEACDGVCVCELFAALLHLPINLHYWEQLAISGHLVLASAPRLDGPSIHVHHANTRYMTLSYPSGDICAVHVTYVCCVCVCERARINCNRWAPHKIQNVHLHIWLTAWISFPFCRRTIYEQTTKSALIQFIVSKSAEWCGKPVWRVIDLPASNREIYGWANTHKKKYTKNMNKWQRIYT